MYKNILQSIDNIAIWPVISFVIFFIFFVCLIWYVISADTAFINRMKQLPMDGNQDHTDNNNRNANENA